MTAVLSPATADPLTPVRAALAAMAARPDLPPMRGLAPDLTVADRHGWTPAATLVSGRRLNDLLDTAMRRWRGSPHAAAALAWKCYSYWLSLPAVLGYTAARRVPLVVPESVIVRWSPRQPFITIGLTPAVEVAVLPTDPLAGLPGVTVVADEAALLALLRSTVMDDHLAPILEQIKARLHLGRRTLWGSLAAGVAHGLSRADGTVPGAAMANAAEMLTALGLDDLVDLAPRPGDHGGLTIQRRTCCLAFTLPESRVCGGCCIR